MRGRAVPRPSGGRRKVSMTQSNMAELDRTLSGRAEVLREVADLCNREALRFLAEADRANGRDKKDIRAKAAGAYVLRRQILALIEQAPASNTGSGP
jgi:hypothetical protein